MLKTCASQLSPALTTIIHYSIDSGKLSTDWLNANVFPIYKKGDVHLSENYRPVSLICVSCKILEHIICKYILDHLEKNKILTALNYSFRSGYICETQPIMTVNDLLGETEVGSQMNTFSKAFDIVPHQRMLHNMKLYDIDGNINSWLCDFLMKRRMKAVVDGDESESVTVESGEPQVAVLGPLLFLCHISDISSPLSVCLPTTAFFIAPSRTWKITLLYRGTPNS